MPLIFISDQEMGEVRFRKLVRYRQLSLSTQVWSRQPVIRHLQMIPHRAVLPPLIITAKHKYLPHDTGERHRGHGACEEYEISQVYMSSI